MRRHGHASGVLFPSFAGSSGGSGGEVGAAGKIEVGVTDSAAHREATRLAMRSIWSYVLGDRIDDETPLLDDVPFASYGGDSVLAVQIISTCARHGLSLPRTLATKLEQMTIAQLLPILRLPHGRLPARLNHVPWALPSACAATAVEKVDRLQQQLRRLLQLSPLPPPRFASSSAIHGCPLCRYVPSAGWRLRGGRLSAAERLAATGGWHPAHAADKHGNTALMWAAGGGHLPVVRWLLESQGVAVDTTNRTGGARAPLPVSRPPSPALLSMLPSFSPLCSLHPST